MGRPFQDCRVLDLRENGLLALTGDGKGVTGVMFRDRHAHEMGMQEFCNYIKAFIDD